MRHIQPKTSALIAFVLTLPIGLIWTSIVFQIEIIETVFKSLLTTDGQQPSVFGHIFIFGGLLLLPVGLVLSLWPMFRKGRRFYIANSLVVVLIVVIMWPTWGGLLKDIYNCDILKIPNCD